MAFLGLLLVTIATWFLPSYSQEYFILKHTLTFITIGSLVIYIILKTYKKILSRYEHVLSLKKLRVLQGGTILIIVIALSIVRIQQNIYIEEAETPPVIACYYYDDQGNYIHGSRMSYNCPEPVIISNDDEQLILEFAYTFIGEPLNSYGGGSATVGNADYIRVDDGYGLSRVEIHYNEEGIITYRKLEEAINYIQINYTKDESITDFQQQFRVTGETKVSNYFKAEIITDVQENEIVQTKNVYHHRNQLNNFDSIEEVTYYDFTEEDLKYDTVYRVYYQNQDNHLSYDIYVDLPIRERFALVPTYEGYVMRNDDEYTLDYRWSEGTANPDIGREPEVSDQYIFHTQDTMTHKSVHFGFYKDDTYTMLDDVGFYILTSEVDLSDGADEIYDYHSDISLYKDTYYFENRFNSYVLSKTTYGFLMKEYGQDGLREGERPHVSAAEVQYIGFGIDERVISYMNPQSLFHEYQPVFSINPIMRYLLDEKALE